eukprot:Skav229671  [mRNA]  locus=scaffold4264:59938:61269:+ [translate_table: standard]
MKQLGFFALPSWLVVFVLHPAISAQANAELSGTAPRHLEEEDFEEEEEEEESLPSGVRVKNALNESIELQIFPSWDIFLGFSDRRKILEGRLTIISVYEDIAYDFVTEPHGLIDVENFGDGTKTHLATLKLDNPMTGRESSSTSTVYIGEFAQAASPNFDMTCYPFDSKETIFRISLQKPGDMIFKLTLGCINGEAGNTTLNGKVLTTCTWPAMGTYVGFEWSNFTCTQEDDEQISCSMSGVRQWGAIFNSYMLPSVIFTLMGFLAFTLDVKMAMPRVATTMLSLVSLTNLRNSLVATLPISGEISWLEEYYLVSMTFMFLNLAGHAISFFLDVSGRKGLQKLVNKINLWGMIQVMWLIVFIRLHSRQCELVDSPSTSVVVALLSISTFAFFLFVFVYYRRPLKETFWPTCPVVPTSRAPDPVVPSSSAPPRLLMEGKGPEDD